MRLDCTTMSSNGIATQTAPEESPWIGYLAPTALIMLLLGLAKRATARRIDSEPLAAEAQMSMLYVVLFVAVAAVNEAREHFEEAGEMVE